LETGGIGETLGRLQGFPSFPEPKSAILNQKISPDPGY